MRNIPVFTTEFGVASLILKEIPYTQTAYIKILSSLAPVELLEECRSFCRAAGAEKIYAELCKYYNCEFDDRGNIGKRYRRQDEIGTPFCITYDFESETDGAVTPWSRFVCRSQS